MNKVNEAISKDLKKAYLSAKDEFGQKSPFGFAPDVDATQHKVKPLINLNGEYTKLSPKEAKLIIKENSVNDYTPRTRDRKAALAQPSVQTSDVISRLRVIYNGELVTFNNDGTPNVGAATGVTGSAIVGNSGITAKTLAALPYEDIIDGASVIFYAGEVARSNSGKLAFFNDNPEVPIGEVRPAGRGNWDSQANVKKALDDAAGNINKIMGTIPTGSKKSYKDNIRDLNAQKSEYETIPRYGRKSYDSVYGEKDSRMSRYMNIDYEIAGDYCIKRAKELYGEAMDALRWDVIKGIDTKLIKQMKGVNRQSDFGNPNDFFKNKQ